LKLSFSQESLNDSIPVTNNTEWILSGDSSFSPDSLIQIEKIEFEILNSFEDSRSHTEYEKKLFNFLHGLRFKTKPSAVEANLFFREGETIRFENILESERNLRSQRFISDAQIKLKKLDNGKYLVHVRSSDNWTTNAALNVSKPGNEWFYNIGLVEYDLLGYGIETGAIYSKLPERTTSIFHFQDKHFFTKNHTLALNYQDASDGHTFLIKSTKPFVSKDDRWGYTAKYFQQVSNQYLYLGRTWKTPWNTPFDQNQPFVEISQFSNGQQILTYPEVYRDSMRLSVAYGKGKTWKNYYRFEHVRKFQESVKGESLILKSKDCATINSGPNIIPTQSLIDSCLESGNDLQTKEYYGVSKDYAAYSWGRKDALIGLTHTLQYIHYLKVKNFKSTKWTEDLDLGFTLQNTISRNILELGARTEDWYFRHQFSFLENIGQNHFLSGGAFLDYFFDDEPYHGTHQLGLGYVYKSGQWSTNLKGNYAAYFNSPWSRQWALGGFQGLTGFPDFYYAGQAISWFKLEQRYFPEFEVGTAVPVPAIFLSGGNGWKHIEYIDWRELEYSLGFGLRVGLSKSVLGIVNHLNLSWPLNGPRENGIKGAVFTLTTEANL